jgi:hypothetical protein
MRLMRPNLVHRDEIRVNHRSGFVFASCGATDFAVWLVAEARQPNLEWSWLSTITCHGQRVEPPHLRTSERFVASAIPENQTFFRG